jgi:hypothetical protein
MKGMCPLILFHQNHLFHLCPEGFLRRKEVLPFPHPQYLAEGLHDL